jgi:hypothetical protein
MPLSQARAARTTKLEHRLRRSWVLPGGTVQEESFKAGDNRDCG